MEATPRTRYDVGWMMALQGQHMQRPQDLQEPAYVPEPDVPMSPATSLQRSSDGLEVRDGLSGLHMLR